MRTPTARRALVALALATLWGPAPARAQCTPAALAAGTQTFSTRFDGLERSYDVHVPASYDGSSPVPLVLDFHGYTSTKEAQAFISGFKGKADTEGFIIVHPQGHENSWNGGICCGVAAWVLDLDDVGLALAIVNEVSSVANIDLSRIYATGLSNGGAMTQRIACDAAHVFAAAVPVSFPLGLVPFSQCQPSQPIALSHFHGLQDTLVLYDDPNGIFATSPESFAYWGQVNGCDPDSLSITFDDGMGSICETFLSCQDGVQVELCSLVGTHVLYFDDDELPIEDAGWDFMSQFTNPLTDMDEDGILDVDDNCPTVSNTPQTDADEDCLGDACDPQICGNGIQELSEACDDGNTMSGDGCSSDCQLASVQTKEQQGCINALNKSFARVAKSQGKYVCGCIKDGAKDKLPGTIEECLLPDVIDGQVAKAVQKALSAESKKCAGTPPTFGATGADVLSNTAIQKELDLVHDVFGADLDGVIIREAKDKPDSKCQQAAAKAVKKCQDAKLKDFNSCKKNGLRDGSIQSFVDLQGCMGADLKGKVTKACESKLDATITSKCGGLDLAALFPGCGTGNAAALGECLDRLVECRVCQALNAADALSRDCDDFDDGLTNASCL